MTAACAGLLLLIQANSWARGPGTSAGPIFKQSLGARPAAMGGAFVAVADDADASLWNPAGLAFVPRPVAALSHAAFFQGINLDHVEAAAPLGARGGLGGHFAYMNSGSIDRTVEDPGGSFDAGRSGGHFLDSQLKLDLSAAGAPLDWLGLGGGWDYFRDSVDQNTADGVMIDLGALAHAGSLNYGISLQNVGPEVRGADTLPTILRLGAAAHPSDNVVAAAEYDYQFDSQQNLFALGAEYSFAKMLSLRLGYRRAVSAGAADGFTGGFGAALGSWRFDYAFSPFGQLGVAHQFGLSWRFGPERGARRRLGGPEPVPTKIPETEHSPEEHFMRADVMIAARGYAKAKEELAAALDFLAAEDRRRIRYFDRRGDIALAENDVAAAQGFYADGLRLGASLGLSDPDVADAYAGMGMCLAAKGNKALAIRFLEKSLEFSPSAKTRGAVEDRLKELKRQK